MPVAAEGESAQGCGQAVEHAEAVHKPLGVLIARGERVSDVFVHDDDRAALAGQRPHGSQCADRVRHIVDAFEREHEIVLRIRRDTRRIADLKCHAARDTHRLRVGCRELNRGPELREKCDSIQAALTFAGIPPILRKGHTPAAAECVQ